MSWVLEFTWNESVVEIVGIKKIQIITEKIITLMIILLIESAPLRF